MLKVRQTGYGRLDDLPSLCVLVEEEISKFQSEIR
jgi:hypothetical protein